MTPSDARTLVFGPAYLDRVVRVDQPLVDPARGEPPLDGSVDGTWVESGGAGLRLVDERGNHVDFILPDDWPGPWGTVALGRPLSARAGGVRAVPVRAWGDHLGGMGAGFAAALGGELVAILGAEADPTSRAIAVLLDRHAIPTHPIRVAGHPADWTLLVSGGATGDKLAVGFRGCARAVTSLGDWAGAAGRVRVAAAWPNRWVAAALEGPAEVRMFAPAARNMVDRDPAILDFVDRVDVLCCNRREWELLADREQVAWRVPILVVTDGAAGAEVRFTTPEGEAGRVRVPAFPRARPPRDTNRAGEAFAATVLATLLGHGWTPGVADPALVRAAAERAAAASALVLDREGFGFAPVAEVDAALRVGRVD